MKLTEFFRIVFFEGYWECKYRKIAEEQKLPEVSGEWTGKLKVSSRYWCADPFLVEDEEKTYAFVEIMDRYHSRGLLGYAEITDPQTDVKVNVLLDLGCHASYPNVFKYREKWFMIPETSERGTIELYSAVHFPDKWEKVAILAQGIKAVDTTTFWKDGKLYLFIYQSFGEDNKLSIAELLPYEMKLSGIKVCKQYNDRVGRPGGGVLYMGGEFIRPTQYGVQHYGEKLVFKRFAMDQERNNYREHDCLEMRCMDFTDCKGFIGLHTYNRCAGIEIIDVYKKRFHFFRPVLLVCKRMKIFGYR